MTPTRVPEAIRTAFSIFNSVLLDKLTEGEATAITHSIRVRYNSSKLSDNDLRDVIQFSGLEVITDVGMMLCFIAGAMERELLLAGNLEPLISDDVQIMYDPSEMQLQEDQEIGLAMLERALKKTAPTYQVNEILRGLRSQLSEGEVTYRQLAEILPDYDDMPTLD